MEKLDSTPWRTSMHDGVYTALITPFLEDGSLDEEGLKFLIQRQIHAGIQGIVIIGSTGEGPTILPKEREKMIQIARSLIKAPMQLIVGTGTNSTFTTVEETKRAEALGADAAMIVTPYYNKPTQEGIYLHYAQVAESSSLPIIVYNVPSRTGQNLQTITLKRLLDIENIVAIKEASGNMQQIMEVIELIASEKKPFKVFSGDDNLTLPLMAVGGHGIFSVVSNLIPELMRDLFLACKLNRWDEAKRLHYELSPLFKGTFIETNPIPIKALMHFEGLPGGGCRLPLCALTPENEKKLRHIHETIKLPLLNSLHG